VMAIKRPLRLLEAASDKDTELNAKLMKVDSDQALRIALAEEILKNLKITASQMKLERYEERPVWKIKLWAARVKRPSSEVEVGEIFVAAEDGKVIKLDIKPNKAD
jgi:hypothetical protein